MRVLLDECVPRKLKYELPSHQVRTVPEMGWAGIKNSELLRLASSDFDVFLTVDRNIVHQQNIASFGIAIVMLVAVSNDIDVLRPLMQEVQEALLKASAGQLIRVGA